MPVDDIDFKMGNTDKLYYLEISINTNEVFKYEFFDLLKNIYTLVETGFLIQQHPIYKPHYFTIDTYDFPTTFKISPLPPTDCIIFGIPTASKRKKNCVNRLDFCTQLKACISQFMQDMNLDYFGNPNTDKQWQDYNDERWKIISHAWFD